MKKSDNSFLAFSSVDWEFYEKECAPMQITYAFFLTLICFGSLNTF